MMKTLSLLLLSLFLAVSSPVNATPSEADQKWKAVVAEMIAAGPRTISTPLQRRVEIVKELAEKAGRTCEVKRSSKGFSIKVS